jgi:arylsulfatase A-like enzyme
LPDAAPRQAARRQAERHRADRALTRRTLLGGGAAALGGVASGLARAPVARAAARPRGRAPRNVLLIVCDRLRADAVGAYGDDYDGTHPAHTPNLDALAGGALRFRHAVPEAMPAVPVRRALLTGMRAYPFRDWTATPGLPAIPGWNGIHPEQPLLPELLLDAGVATAWVTDNPLLGGARARRWVRTTRPLPSSARHRAGAQRSYLQPLEGGPARVEPAARVLAKGLDVLGELRRREPFFLALDAFDADELFAEPVSWVSGPPDARADLTSAEPVDRSYGREVPVRAGDGVRARVWDRYRAEVEHVDRAIGRVLQRLEDLRLADRTLVYVLGDCGIALGEQGIYGYPAGVHHRRAYEVPYLIRDPEGRRAGDESDWFASSHDVAPTVLSHLGVTIPGKLAGEDLTALLDDDDVPPRPFFTSALDSRVIVGDTRWLLLARTDKAHRELYETEHADDPEDISRETIDKPTQLEALWRAALDDAGGTLPQFSATAAKHPRPERGDDRVPDDGTLTSDERDANKLSHQPVGGG